MWNWIGKFVAVHARRAHKRRGVMAPVILNLGPRLRRVVTFMRRPLYRQVRGPNTH